MSLVTLTSGGLDSTLMVVLAKEEAVDQYPLFINYGQRSLKREWQACQLALKKHCLRSPERVDLSDFGHLIPSGLTNQSLDINKDAFLPGRNALFLLVGAAYAYGRNADSVGIGLLNERFSIFPDQTGEFITRTQELINLVMGKEIKILTPLIDFSKKEVIALARSKGINDTYSCHAGTEQPCGECIACQEFKGVQ